MKGYDYDLLDKLSAKLNVPIVTSGGAVLQSYVEGHVGASAVAASIYHFTEKTPTEAKRFLINKNIMVRKNFDIE